MAWSATCFLAQMFSQQTAQLLVYSGIKCYSVGRGLASQLLSRSVLKSSRIDSFKNGLVFLMILARNRFKGCLKRPEGQIYFCFPWIWRVSSEASQFLTLKMFVYFFFFPGRQRREGVKEWREMPRGNCVNYSPCWISSNKTWAAFVGGNPPNAWIDDGCQTNWDLVPVYINQGKKHPLFSFPLSSNCTKYFKRAAILRNSLDHVVKCGLTLMSICWLLYVSKERWMFKRSHCSSTEIFTWLIGLPTILQREKFLAKKLIAFCFQLLFFSHSVPICVARNTRNQLHFEKPWEKYPGLKLHRATDSIVFSVGFGVLKAFLHNRKQFN